MTNREKMLKRVQVYDFVLNDTALFLNNNPNDQKALAHYRKYQALQRAAVKDFEEMYGPISRGNYDGGSQWKWVDGPWPWQTEEA